MVAGQLAGQGISHWLPLLERRSKWSDRYVTVTEPLFPGYVFVRLACDEYTEVVKTRGVVRIVSFNGKPVPIPSAEIDAVRLALASRLQCDPYPLLHAGREVVVRRGPLKGYRGVLQRRNGRHRILLSIPLIGQSVAVEIEAAYVKAQ